MLKDGRLTYVSLFSCAGVGCYGFLMEDYVCVATNELLPRRLNVQRYNHKCQFDTGYVDGDITSPETKDKLYSEIDRWAALGNDRIDVVVATPPCQGISVINHKKTNSEINRNSLVVESVELVQKVKPRFFVFENVAAFEKTLCMTPAESVMPIGEFIRISLGSEYCITSRVLNFMNYGSNSSRTRTLVIGVDKQYRNNITPFDIFPEYRPEKTLRDVIHHFPSLEWGEISDDDFYHAFRTYDEKMRAWIHDLKEGESAFDNADPLLRPHKIVNGEVVSNIRKNRDKYTRQLWDRFIQCVHTRNDQLAAQNTVHPEQDRVYSIRELMEMMTIPASFRWIDMSIDELNALSDAEKRALYKSHEMNIRQCIGEAVPTAVMHEVAHNIKKNLMLKRFCSVDIRKIIQTYQLDDCANLHVFVKDNPEHLDLFSLMRITELCNSKREDNAAFYTNKFIINEIMGRLPTVSKDEIHIIEPSVGAGGFLPFLFKKYEDVPRVILDVVDIDADSIAALKAILSNIRIPPNFEIHYITHDFLTIDFPYRFDLAVGNPPFSKLKGDRNSIAPIIMQNANQHTLNLSELFLEKCIRCSDCVALVLNKTILSTDEFEETRQLLRRMKIESIIDFGRNGFTGVSIETMCMVVYPNQKPANTFVINMKYNTRTVKAQKYITDERFPYFIVYRDDAFDAVADKLTFGVFDVFRDRQITKANTVEIPENDSLWVIKAKNINDDGGGVTHIEGYDRYIDAETASKLNVYPYVNNTEIYLTPNMTYNPRVIKNIPGVIPDGSVAVLIPKENQRLTERQRLYFSTEEYRRFYLIARNLSTQSINVDRTSVYFYGVLKDDE